MKIQWYNFRDRKRFDLEMPKDRICWIEANVPILRLWKLFKKELEIEEISIKGATVDTRNFLDGMVVNGLYSRDSSS